MDKPRLWTRDFLIITLENFFVYFTYYLLITVIAVYATEKFHASPSAAGLSAGIFIIGAIAGRLYGGTSIERIGHKKLLYISFACYLATTLLYFAVSGLGFLIAIRLLHGAAFGLTSTATGTIAAEIIPNERRGEGTGYYALSMTLATAIGPFLGMFLTLHVNFKANLVVCAAALSISLLAAFTLTVPAIKPAVGKASGNKRIAWDGFFEIRAVPISIVTALICFAYSSILAFLSSYVKSIHLIETGSFFFLAYAVAILISRPFTGYWFDRKGENFIIYPTFLLFAAALFLLGHADQGYLILLAAVILGFGYGNYFASGQALAVKVSPQNRKALATSTYFIFADLGSGIGPFLLGVVIPVLGYRGLYFGMAALVLATGFAYYFLHGKKAGSERTAL